MEKKNFWGSLATIFGAKNGEEAEAKVLAELENAQAEAESLKGENAHLRSQLDALHLQITKAENEAKEAREALGKKNAELEAAIAEKERFAKMDASDKTEIKGGGLDAGQGTGEKQELYAWDIAAMQGLGLSVN